MMKLKTSKDLDRTIGSLRQPGLQLRDVLHAFVIGFDLKFLNFHSKYSIFHFAQEVSPENMVFHIFTSQKVRIVIFYQKLSALPQGDPRNIPGPIQRATSCCRR